MTRQLFILILLAICIQTTSYSQDSLEFVGWSHYHTPNYICVADSYMYVSAGAFAVVDISNPSNYNIVSNFRPFEKGISRDLVAKGNTVYTYWTQFGLRTIDVTNKAQPVFGAAQYYDSNYNFHDFILQGDSLYCLAEHKPTNSHLIRVFDISNPNQLNLVITLNLSLSNIANNQRKVHSMIIDNDVLFINTVTEQHQFDTIMCYAYSLSNLNSNSIPFDTLLVGTVKNDYGNYHNPVFNFKKKGDYIYFSGKFFSPNISDVIIYGFNNNQFSNTPLASYNWQIEPHEIFIDSTYLYLTNDTSFCFIYDISSPLNPVFKKKCKVSLPKQYNNYFNIKVKNNWLYLHMWDNYAVYTYDIPYPVDTMYMPQQTGIIKFGHDLADIEIKNNQLIAVIWDFYQLYSYDISNPISPALQDRFLVRGSGSKIEIEDTLAFISMGFAVDYNAHPDSSGGMYIYNISNPNNFTEISHFRTYPPYGNNMIVDVKIKNNIAIAALGMNLTDVPNDGRRSNNPGLYIADISNLSNPIAGLFIPFFDTAHQVIEMAVIDTMLYIAASKGGLYCYSISNPSNPVFIDTIKPGNKAAAETNAVAVTNNWIFIAHDTTLFAINRLTLTVEDFIPFNERCTDIELYGNKAFVSTETGLYVIDISTPNNLIIITSKTDKMVGVINEVKVNPPYVYVSSTMGGIYILKYWGQLISVQENDLHPTCNLCKVYPNPFDNAINIEIPFIENINEYTIVITDIQGRVIRKTRQKNVYGQANIFTWYSNHENGETITGIYFLTLLDEKGKRICNSKILKVGNQ